MLKRSFFAVALLSLLAASAAHAQQPALVFTAIPDEDETRLVERFSQSPSTSRASSAYPSNIFR